MKENYCIIANKLNKLANKYFDNIDSLVPIHIYKIGIDNVSICPDHEFAFSLKPPEPFKIQELKSNKDLNNSAVYITNIPYILCLNMSENKVSFIFYMSHILNHAMTQLAWSVGSLNNRKKSTQGPGNCKVHFRQSQNIAGYELRVFVFKNEDKS